jgi:hypothetical protein
MTTGRLSCTLLGPAGDRLARYAAAFATAELNSSFYRWPRPSGQPASSLATRMGTP